jgi:hypothetical protein
MIRSLALAVSVLALSVPALAQKKAAPQGPFDAARGFKCAFPVYDTARWTGTKPEIFTGDQTFAFQVDSFDFKKGRARIASDSGSTLASMILTQTGLNVIEQTPIGNFNLTTIFVAGGTDTTYLAVNSRHNGDVSAAPKISQNYGTCELVK